MQVFEEFDLTEPLDIGWALKTLNYQRPLLLDVMDWFERSCLHKYSKNMKTAVEKVSYHSMYQ